MFVSFDEANAAVIPSHKPFLCANERANAKALGGFTDIVCINNHSLRPLSLLLKISSECFAPKSVLTAPMGAWRGASSKTNLWSL
jgi:hypothetical protein